METETEPERFSDPKGLVQKTRKYISIHLFQCTYSISVSRTGNLKKKERKKISFSLNWDGEKRRSHTGLWKHFFECSPMLRSLPLLLLLWTKLSCHAAAPPLSPLQWKAKRIKSKRERGSPGRYTTVAFAVQVQRGAFVAHQPPIYHYLSR